MAASIKQNGNDVTYLEYSITESFAQVATEAKILTLGQLGDGDVSINGASYQIVEANNFNRVTTEYKLLPSAYCSLLQTSFEWFDDTKKFEELMGFYGIDVCMQYKSQPSYWCLPYTKLRTLLELTQDLVDIPGGGGVVMTFDNSGRLYVSDLKKAMDGGSQPLTGELSGIITNTEWLYNIEGFQHMEKYLIKGYESYDINLQPRSGKADYCTVIFNESNVNNDDTYIRNTFYKKFYTSCVRTYKQVFMDEAHIGAKIKDVEGNESVIYQIKVHGNTSINDVEFKTVSRW